MNNHKYESKTLNVSSSISRIVIAWLALQAVRTGVRYAFLAGEKPSAQYLLWSAIADFLMVATLGLLAIQVDWRGLRLGVAISAILFAVDSINFIEGMVFLGGLELRNIYRSALVYALMAPVLAFLFTKKDAWPRTPQPLLAGSPAKRVMRFIASDVLYVLLYVTAGSIIFPLVKDFYALRPLPSPGKIILLQLLLRGPVFTAICLLLIKMAGEPRRAKVFIVGMSFAILSGSVLLLPSSYLPDWVRWIHWVEVTGSGFVFGVMMTYIWRVSSGEEAALRVTKHV